MDIFQHDLESIKTTCFLQLHLTHKVYRQVFIDDAITGCKKSKYMGSKMAFAIIKGIPVLHVIAKVDFLRRPETGFMFFILFPNFWILNRKNNKAVFVFFQ